jgi:8-amino-7-oxononanoate synthase
MDLIDREPLRVKTLHERIAQFRAGCAAGGIALGDSQTAIQPVPVGDAQRALEVAARLDRAGFLVPAIRPPTVPEGTSRLRVSLSAAHRGEDVDALVDALGAALKP